MRVETNQPAEILRHRFTVDDYYQMAAVGILSSDTRSELLQGDIVDMSPAGARHAGVVNRVCELLFNQVGGQVVISVQNPVRLDVHSQPEPDLAILKRRSDHYDGQIPTAADVLLVVEICDSSMRLDREMKLPLYSAAKIPEVWLVNLPDDTVEVCRQPGGGNYEIRTVLRGDDSLLAAGVEGLQFTVNDVVGNRS